MARENKTEYVILGLLLREPRSGYDIKAFISQSIGFFWQESYGQLYPTLKRLRARGLIDRRVQSRKGRPERHVYRITPAGRRRLAAWLKAETRPAPLREEGLLKLFFGTAVPPPIHIHHVEALLKQQEGRLQAFKRVEDELFPRYRHEPDFDYWRATLEFGKHVTRARVRWCRQTLAWLRGEAASASPPLSSRGKHS